MVIPDTADSAVTLVSGRFQQRDKTAESDMLTPSCFYMRLALSFVGASREEIVHKEGAAVALHIFWNHVGREHESLGYARSLRKNPPEVIQRGLEAKEQRSLAGSRHRYVRYDDNTLLELPMHKAPHGGAGDRPFIIVYCLDRGLQFSLHYKKQYAWWLVDIVEIEQIRPDVYCVHDLFIDIAVHDDGSYEVYDIDEFEAALSIDAMSPRQVSHALKSFHDIVTELNAKSFPGPLLQKLEQTYIRGG
ncbi:MAG: hypothetical protein K0Q59_5224 [Paenibacillus sp.]|nr:hypothetical protein [Paenibacillus sp.]